MKTVVLGDVHFGCGYSIGTIMPYTKLNSRLIDYSNTFDYVIDYMKNNSITNLVITGDIFENRRPQASELSLFSEKIKKLEEYNIDTHIVIGNHDLIREQKITTIDVLKKLKLPKVFIHSDICSASCSKDNNFLNFIFLPYRTKYMLGCDSNTDAVKILTDILQYELKNIKNSGPKIVVGHFMIEGIKLSEVVLEGSAGEVVLSKEMFNNIDAIIMGHIHQYQILKNDPLIAYIGSMERKDFGDNNVEKYFLVFESSNNELIYNFVKLPVRCLYDIIIDKSLFNNSDCIIEEIFCYLKQYDEKYNLKNSIVRVTIFLNESVLFNFDKNKIKDYLNNTIGVYSCLNIHLQIVSKKQVRKESITERQKPEDSFLDYLEFIEDNELKKKIKEIGLKIINNNK